MKIVRLFFNSKLSSKTIMYFLTIFILFAIFCLFTFERLNSSLTSQKVNQISTETVNSLNTNLDFLINTVSNQSEMLISSSTIQTALRNGVVNYNNAQQEQMDNYLAEFTNFNDAISSIYIFDNGGHEYCVDNLSYRDISLDKIREATWYNELCSKEGGYMLRLNIGGIYDAGDKNIVSLMRVVNDLNTQKPIGVMIVNISEDYINESFASVTNATNTKIILDDEFDNQIIHGSLPTSDGLAATFKNIGSKGLTQIKKLGGTQYIISCLKNRYDWTLATVTPITELTSQTQTYSIFVVIIMLVSVAMLFAALLFTSLFISRPVEKLAKAMNSVKDGTFSEVHVRTGADEIGMLKDVYNLMIREIQKLFDNVVLEQRNKRRAELEAMQLQIKPHFLYNSFDAISSLALSGKNRDVYTIVKALGKFYRSFLNTDSEEITVGEELEIIRQYLTIQRIRFRDKFTVVWQVDERVKGVKLPRLTLQPLVENAIKHGIKEKEGPGVITICAAYGDGKIELEVRDDGVGMDKEKLEAVRSGSSCGAGLKLTRERLELYFDFPSVLEIDSEKGRGTAARITVPIDKEASLI